MNASSLGCSHKLHEITNDIQRDCGYKLQGLKHYKWMFPNLILAKACKDQATTNECCTEELSPYMTWANRGLMHDA